MAAPTLYSTSKGNLSAGLWVGASAPANEFDLGNLKDITVATKTASLTIENSYDGIGLIDETITTENTTTIKFTTYAQTTKMLSMLFSAFITKDIQTAGAAIDEISAVTGTSAMLSKREVGSYQFNVGTVTGGPFVVGTTVTSDNTDVGTGVISEVGAGYVCVVTQSGTFEAADVITSGAVSATISAAGIFVPGKIVVKTHVGNTVYVAGTDFECISLMGDERIGRVRFLEAGAVVDDSAVDVIYNHAASTVESLEFGSNPSLYVSLRYFSKNQIGSKNVKSFYHPKVQLVPAGDYKLLNLKGEPQEISFEGTVLVSGGASVAKIY